MTEQFKYLRTDRANGQTDIISHSKLRSALIGKLGSIKPDDAIALINDGQEVATIGYLYSLRRLQAPKA